MASDTALEVNQGQSQNLHINNYEFRLFECSAFGLCSEMNGFWKVILFKKYFPVRNPQFSKIFEII